jgi:16S rRNA (cytosine1402-N4)-methyltransferase
MPAESLRLLDIQPEGRYIDATLGSGGHAELILQKLGDRGRLLAIDWDAGALERCGERLRPYGEKVILKQSNFQHLPSLISEMGWTSVNGILFDLGISSVQIFGSGKGIALEADEPLDMRLDPSAPLSAQDIIARWDNEQLSNLFEQYGQRPGAHRAAAVLKDTLKRDGSLSARKAAEVLRRTLPRRGRVHPATRVFLALRSTVNREMENLNFALAFAPDQLVAGGVCAFISFQSEEDRAVKWAFRERARNEGENFEILTPKPLIPSAEEMKTNPRSRSAKLRALRKLH